MGSIYIGSPIGQKANLIFDLGSNWLTVTSDLCKECYKTNFS
jgi:hypothetical protein